MPAPGVSAVIPVYNRPDFLPQVVATLQSQSFPDWEAIIVDDGSSLDIAAAVTPFLADSRIRFLRLERNGGAGAARNHGVAAARGRYVAFLDSDDLWHPDKLSKQTALLDAQPAGEMVFCVTFTTVIMPGGFERVRPNFAPRPGQPFADYLYRDGGFAQASSLMLPRALALATPFREGLQQYEDHLLFIELHAKGARYLVVPDALTTWRNDDRPDRLGRNDDLARGASFLTHAGPLLTPPLQTAFRVRTLDGARLHRNPAGAARLVLTAIRQGALAPRQLAMLLARQIVPASLWNVLRRTAG